MNINWLLKFFQKFNYIVLCLFTFCANNLLADAFDKEFIESFIKHYEFNAEGRYAHEYHPALLSKTAFSLDALEDKLVQNGFNLSGRIVICGYEEHAVPSYYTDFRKSKINDEASSKNNAGWSLRLHNQFGFMTGFLFKDINWFSQQWFAGNGVFEHIDSDDIEIFDDRAEIFQGHAFGPALNLIIPAQRAVIKEFGKQNFKGIFEELVKFWNCIYGGEIKVRNKQVAGTQDILFSIEYAKHLVRSTLPFFNFYIGPDITYPIEVSVSQKKGATIHAQNFVKKFSERLKAIDNKPTVYVFCSFVDGVGKSTMLGNIKNHRKYGDQIEKYERVDNSSSQLADVFKVEENIFIADLPAQVSHFTYKPDGLVYVGIGRELEKINIETLQKYVRENQAGLKQNYELLLEQVEKLIAEQDYFAPDLTNSTFPEKAFARNLFLLKKTETNKWIPFAFDGKNYLFNQDNTSQIRVLVQLGQVQSEGLKNIESEQMLFFDGLRFPAPYNFFVNNFLEKLRAHKIENVVFVDFTSMYPRSSRENIRLNYLLQQMSLLDELFEPKYSLYRDFTNGAELLALLKEKKSFEKLLRAFKLEVLTRLALFKMLDENTDLKLKSIEIFNINDSMRSIVDKILQHYDRYLNDLAIKKLISETNKLEDIFGLTRNFVNVQQFCFQDAIVLSHYMSDFFCKYVDNYNLNMLWQDVGKVIGPEKNFVNAPINEVLLTDKSARVRAFFCFDSECKDERLLTPFLRTLRGCFYAAISNLLQAKEFDSGLVLEKEKYYVPSLFVQLGTDKKVYLFQKIFEEWQEKIPVQARAMMNLFNLSNLERAKWGIFSENPYLLDWKNALTNKNIFAFDCDPNTKNKSGRERTISTFLVQKYQKEFGQDNVISASKFYEKLSESNLWKYEWRQMLKQAYMNTKNQKSAGTKKAEPKKQDVSEEKIKKDKQEKYPKIFLGQNEQMYSAKLLIILLATLEMFVHDPEADIVVRRGNRQDFAAALKLFEKITLPKYFGIIFENDLFDNYEEVEPYPSWDEWDFVKEE
jgi:hypothetical protein